MKTLHHLVCKGLYSEPCYTMLHVYHLDSTISYIFVKLASSVSFSVVANPRLVSLHSYFKWTKICGLCSMAMSLSHLIKMTLICQNHLTHISNFPDVLKKIFFSF